MLRSLQLLIPAIIPSWRFFDAIAPSPRIEFALLENRDDPAADWEEFRPRPEKLSLVTAMKHMFFNPVWNETLFLVSCSERLIEKPTDHSKLEILKRLRSWLATQPIEGREARFLQFRLVFVTREDAQIIKEIEYTSETFPFGSDQV